jgi:Rho GDP-dissociation inhibitor
MSSAVEAISCSKVDVPAAPEPEAAAAAAVAKTAAAVPAVNGDAANGKCGDATPHCHDEEEDEEEAPKVIDLGPRVSIKDQLEKDKVRGLLSRCHFAAKITSPSPCPVILLFVRLRLASVSKFRCVSSFHFISLQDDESLRRWKEQLLGSVDLNSVGGKLS